MLKLLHFFRSILPKLPAHSPETGANWGRWVASAFLGLVAIWAVVKFLWFWAFLAALGIIYLMATGRTGPGNDGVGE